jgi:hypothetical protein
LNEPIPGHGVFWSSVGGKSYPIPLRVLSFERQYALRDPKGELPAGKTFARDLKARYDAAIAESRAAAPVTPASTSTSTADSGSSATLDTGPMPTDSPEDVYETYRRAAIAKVAADRSLITRIRKQGIPWRGIVEALENALSDVLDDRNKIAYDLVPPFLDATFGKGGWESERRPKKSGGGNTTWVVVK